MWFDQSRTNRNWAAGRRHLARVDPVMRKIIARVGPCALAPRRDYFVVLCKSIFTQQISTKIAAILFKRFSEQFPRKRPTPQLVVKFLDPKKGDEALIRRCGISRQKRLYLLDLAKHFVRGEIPTKRFGQMSDDEIIESLTRVHGIGRWTGEMFLIFVL